MKQLVCIDLNKNLARIHALRNINIEIKAGECVAIVGPRNSGKTTLLHLIAGIQQPDSGDIFIGDEAVTHWLPQHRNVGLIEQNYPLLPERSVVENVVWGLGKIGKNQRLSDDADAVLLAIGIENLRDTCTEMLTDLQVIRVAIARMLILRPEVLLIDDVMQQLEAVYKATLRQVISTVHKLLQTTVVYAARHIDDVLGLAQRIIIVNQRGIEQVGTISQLQQQPNNFFVANYVANSELNRIPVVVTRRLKKLIHTRYNDTVLKASVYNGHNIDERVVLTIPFEQTCIAAKSSKHTDANVWFAGVVLVFEDIGYYQFITVQIDAKLTLSARVRDSPRTIYTVGDSIQVGFNPMTCQVFAEDGQNVQRVW